ncbi:type II CAAX endopeptidase family protein [Halobellus clavatus]|jgi:membrane protease YdiL (CAAX protease family)|uniref:Membrane protease YdiL, CAAX protease family n=1 Tax=Halobellus clavatus TaxID=660517 RepID=A0A1H3GXH1_9EURY|nr:type II CAAX endopeptidase family protein [Halobellus clavatus]SDY08023.1 Membrane protease YdiL, CAAX protease family [Halobellus clavatus]
MQSIRSLLERLTNEQPVVVFSILAIGVSWTVWLTTFSVTTPRSGLGYLGMGLGAFGPGVAGAAVTRLRGESVRAWLATIFEWRRPLRWYGLAIAVPVVGALGVGVVVFSLVGLPDSSSLGQLAPLFLFNLVLATLFTGGNEEFGWRGFALPHLQKRFSALTASVLVGGVWALWHVPMFVYDVYPHSPVLYTASVVSFAVILTWYYNASDGSVLGAVLLHGTINAAVNVPGQVVGGAAAVPVPYAVILTGVFGVLAALLVLRYGPATLSHRDVVRPRWTETQSTDGSAAGNATGGRPAADPSD